MPETKMSNTNRRGEMNVSSEFVVLPMRRAANCISVSMTMGLFAVCRMPKNSWKISRIKLGKL